MKELYNDIGLKINVPKKNIIQYNTKYKHKNMQPKIQNINYKAKFKYLSLLVTGGHDFGKDVRARMTARSRSHQALSKL
jgi:hypothetical protein